MPGAAPEHQGHLGDLHTKSTAELIDLLRRQESVLQKQKFLRSLPDGGRKVRAFAETLHRIITERRRHEMGEVSEMVEDMAMETSRVKTDNAGRSVGVSQAQTSPVRSSQFAKLRDKHKASEDIRGADNTTPDTEFVLKVQALSVKEEPHDSQDSDGHLSQLINTAQSEKIYVHGEHPVREHETVNSYLNIMKKSEQASTSARQHFKPNSSLKIKSLEELPEKYRGNGAVKREPVQMEEDGYTYNTQAAAVSSSYSPTKCVIDKTAESSATPPNYKYDQVKVISLDESFQLQKTQALKQEEVRAQHAAERLAGKIHVKMGPYNPEGGMAMAYRSQNDSENELDSDDNVEDYPE